MDFTCESLQKYQYLPFEELSSHIVGEFEYILRILKNPIILALKEPETVQRVYCLACVLWQSQETSHDLSVTLRDDVYDVLLDWTLQNTPQTSENELIKVAVDRILCSMCSIKPDLYDRLLIRLNIINKNIGCENEYNFRHVKPDSELEGIARHSAPVDLKSINLTKNMLKSLGVLSLSCISAYKLIDSQFLSVLIDLVVDFIIKDEQRQIPATPKVPAAANSTAVDAATTLELPYINGEQVCAIIDFLAELCWQNILRMWLSSEENTALWSHLLRYLCQNFPRNESKLKLEASTANFFSKCCAGHFENQKKLANLFYNVSKSEIVGGSGEGLSTFVRKILFEFIISPGRICVSIETDLPEGMSEVKIIDTSLLLPPPAFPPSRRHQLLYFSEDSTCVDILRKIKREPEEISKNDVVNDTSILDMPSTSQQFFDREIDSPPAKRIRRSESVSTDGQLYKLMFWAPNMYQFVDVCQHWSIAQIVQIFVPCGEELEVPVLKFLLTKQQSWDESDEIFENTFLAPPPAIEKFVELEGFKCIALNLGKKPVREPIKGRRRSASVKIPSLCLLNQLSLHALLAFGQFSRLPEYRISADIEAVLRSVIGSNEEANFNLERYSRFFSNAVKNFRNPLMVLPFEFLRFTLSESKLTDFYFIYAPVIDFVLMYLAVYTHQPENKNFNINGENCIYMKAIRQCYWSTSQQNKSKGKSRSSLPKGTGYGGAGGSTSDFLRIEEEEELITSLLSILGTYTRPSSDRPLPFSVVDRLRKSCLLPVITGYLKNDSIFDMVKHIPLYNTIMLVLRSIVLNLQLKDLVLFNAFNGETENPGTSDSQAESIANLMRKLKKQIDDYLRRTWVKTDSGFRRTDNSDREEQILFETISETAELIEAFVGDTAASPSTSVPRTNNNDEEKPNLNTDYDYLKIMKPLQFDEYEMITGTVFNIPYHFRNEASTTMVTIPNRMKRLSMELSSLSSSLPFSRESAIFVRYDENRIDVMKALITGPPDTPYMNGCFEFDIFCPGHYPSNPIMVNFQTTGRNTVRFNPNLYNCGKVCLSLLNTWAGERWNPQTSSILQVLVSIQSMIFVQEPYFNEPGYESSRGKPKGKAASKAYNDSLLRYTIRHAMRDQISSPSACFKKIIHTHFWLKRDEIKAQVNKWIEQTDGLFKINLQAEANLLFNDLDKLTPPE